MGISYNGESVFGSQVFESSPSKSSPIELSEMSRIIKETYNIVLDEGIYDELVEQGVNPDDIDYQDYASKYNNFPLGDYSVLMLIKHGNFIIGDCDVLVGFKIDLNRDNCETIEKKKTIFLNEFEDFKKKTGLRFSQPKHASLVYVM